MKIPCSIALLESALAGNLPAEDASALHQHLEECQQCGAALERLAGGPAWCQEAAALLVRDELDAAVAIHDEWSEIDFSVEHLEPSDAPNVLGRLGGYDVLEIIGRGGMGVVLKGFDRELKRCVAIKVLSPHLAQSSLARKRFAREAQAAAAVVHPNVLAIHQVQPGGRLPFLVMPLVAGESLAQRLTAQGPLELKEILRIGMQAAAGLAAAHEQGLVHRDVKPANILLEKGVERAVLTDFGLARAADDLTLTRWGVIAGTPQYMSPEQARGEPLDSRSDLFSLGCVLYEMATGISPFRTESVMATLRRLVEESPQALASLNPELPRWFIAIVERLLEKHPSRRFSTAKEVSELLEGCLAHLQQPTSVPLPEPAKKAAGTLRVPSAHSNPVLHFRGVLAMIAVLGIGLLGVFALSTNPPDIAGQWNGADWGQVVLKKTSDAEYTGSFSETVGKQPGEIQLKWSRIERRYNGAWREGKDRFGDLSVRLVGDEIRGALTTDAKSKINPATPRLADLTWTRGSAVSRTPNDSKEEKIKSGAGPTLQADIRIIEMPDDSAVELGKLDLAAIEKTPGAKILAAPRISVRSGQACEVEVGGQGGDSFAPTPTGITVRLLPTLDGETVHYKAKLATRMRPKPDDTDRMIIQELIHDGDARLERPVLVDIGKGDKGHRFLAWIVFHQGAGDDRAGGDGDLRAKRNLSATVKEAEKQAVVAAESWLALVDDGKYGESWDAAAEYLKNAVDKDAFEKSLTAARKPLGKLKSREIKSKTYLTKLPGAPDGEYVVIQFETSLENKNPAIETVTPMLGKDKKWRVSGYFIK